MTKETRQIGQSFINWVHRNNNSNRTHGKCKSTEFQSTKQLLLGCPEGVLGQMDDWLVGWLDQRRSYNNKCTVVNDLVARRDDLFELFNSLAQVITAPPPQRPNRSYQFFVGHHERPTAVATCAPCKWPCIIIIAHSCSVDIYSISVTPFTSQLNSATVHLTYPHPFDSQLHSPLLFSSAHSSL